MSTEVHAGAVASDEPAPLIQMLALEEIDRDLYRAPYVFPEEFALYGGQVAAQALAAAGHSVQSDRQPHSLHGYFLRPGHASHPTIFQVFRDRDGRSFSARRVVALQGGEVIFNMSASFQVAENGPDEQLMKMPTVSDSAESALPYEFPRLLSMEARLPEQPHPNIQWPTRFWSRSAVVLPDDDLLHACVLTYLSDISTGLVALEGPAGGSGATIDHAVWFHRRVRMDEWLLTDLVPHTVAHGRGWYTGAMFTASGLLVASLAQEALFRPHPPQSS